VGKYSGIALFLCIIAGSSAFWMWKNKSLNSPNWDAVWSSDIRSAFILLNTAHRIACVDGQVLGEAELKAALSESYENSNQQHVHVKLLSSNPEHCTSQIEVSGTWNNEGKTASKTEVAQLPLSDDEKARLGF
jgi:hypothetical protein